MNGFVGWSAGYIDLQGYSYKPTGKIGKLAGKTLCISAFMCQLMRRRVSTYAQACVNLCAGVCQLMRRLFFCVSTYAQVELGEPAMCQLMRRRVSTYAQ